MTVEELQVIITAQTSGLEKQLNSVKSQLSGLEKTASKSSAGISKVFSKMFKGFSVVAVVTGLTKLGKSAVNVASDLQEVQNVVDVAFGNAAEEINKFASTAVKQLGMSELTAKQMASTFMSMSNGMGIAADSGKNMSIELTKLAGDMASFYNVEQDVAQTALNSVFTGETESLKKFGVVMTQANLDAFALSQGITKSYNAMSQSEKVMLRYKYVMQATSQAQGDFARTSDSWANQTRVLKEQWSQLLGILGKGLIQVLTPVVKVLNQLLGYLISIGNAVAKVFGGKALQSSSASVQSAAEAAGGFDTSMEDAGEGLDDANSKAKKLQKTMGSFDELNVMADNSQESSAGGDAGGIGDIGGTIEATTTDTESQVSGLMDGIKDKLQGLVDYIKPIGDAFLEAFKFDALKGQFIGLVEGAKTKIQEFAATLDFSKYQPAFINLASAIGTYANTVLSSFMTLVGEIGGGLFDALSPFLTEVVNNLIPTFINVLASAYQILSQVVTTATSMILTMWGSIQPIFALVGQMLTDLAADISEFWNSYGEPITAGIIKSIETLGNVFNNLWNTIIAPIISNLVAKLSSLWSGSINPIVKKVLSIIGDLMEMLNALWNNVLAPIVNWLVDTLGPTVVKVVNTVVNVVSKIIEDICKFIGGLLDVLKGVITFLTGVFTGDWEKAWEGIKLILSGIWDAICALVQTAVDLLAGILEIAWTAIKGVVEVVWNAISSFLSITWNAIKSVAESVWNAIKTFFSNTWNAIKTIFTNAVNAVKTAVTNAFNTIKSTLTNIMNGIKTMFSNILTNIKTLWSNMTSGIKTLVTNLHTSLKTIVENIKNTFVNVFTTMKDKVSGVFTSMKTAIVNAVNAIKTGIKTPINGILGFINSLISGVVSGINGMIRALNKLSFDVPDWVPSIGGEKFGFNISTISAPQIPLLANGGVITSPTVAMMGEYAGASHNPEIVAPQSILRQTMAESNEDLIDTLIQLNRQLITAIGNLDMQVKIGDDTIASAVKRANDKSLKTTGYALI